jgi:predicted nucleotidyltransferase
MKDLNDLLENSRRNVLFSCVAGSRAYGTHTEESDEDIRGVYALPATSYLELDPPAAQLADERQNIVYFSLLRFVDLLTAANPNLLELLFMPPDCVRTCTEEMHALILARSIFITRQCGDTHVGYAMIPHRSLFRSRSSTVAGHPCRKIEIRPDHGDCKQCHGGLRAPQVQHPFAGQE